MRLEKDSKEIQVDSDCGNCKNYAKESKSLLYIISGH
jgi:hypothetical protein